MSSTQRTENRRRNQLKHLSSGLCRDCSNKAEKEMTRCPKCLEKKKLASKEFINKKRRVWNEI